MSGAEFETGLHYPIKLSELPATWSFGYVEEFSKLIESGFACGAHNQTGDGVQHLRPMNITSKGVIDLGDARHVPADFNPKRLQEGNVLFNNTNSPALVGKTAHVGPSSSGKAYSNHMTRVVFGEPVDSQFAARQLNFLFTVGYFLHRCVKHVNQASISSRELGRTVPLVVPPLAEQKRIVAKIEELFSELDAGEASLRRARRQLGVYRQSLLKQAFEGKLTAPWRAQHPDLLESPDQLLARIQSERQARYQQQLKEWETAVKTWKASGVDAKKPPKPKLTTPDRSQPSTANLPAGWVWTDLATLKQFSLYGPRFSSDDYSDDGVCVLRTSDIGESGKVNLATAPRLRLNKVEQYQYGCQKGDILITRTGSLGTLAVFNDDVDSIPGAYLIQYRLVADHYAPFIYHFLRGPVGQSALTGGGAGVGRPNLNAPTIEAIPIPLSSLPEQQEIVRLLDAQFSVIEQTEREIAAALKRSEALRQSILKKAFTGQLVPQDPTDEPASILIARIRAEREANAANPARKHTPKKARP